MRLRSLIVAVLLLSFPAAAVAANGQQLYGRYCLKCHGPLGVGQEPPSPTIGPPLRGVGALAADFYLHTGYMPLKRNGIQPRRSRLLLSEPQIHALIVYVASLGGGPAIPTPHPERGNLSQGQQLFADRCAGCHQIAARGGYATHAVPPPLGDATARQIAEAVRIGPFVMPQFSQKQLTNAQLDSVVRYVLWTKHPDDRGGWSLGRIGPVPEGLVTWFFAAAVLVGVCMLVGRRIHE
jgi:ubiquinol-cytochrome c reductase cytochrome c subunit